MQAALSINGEIVYDRGFGFSDLESMTEVEPESRFRVASLAKPITSAAVFRLVEMGLLDMDGGVLDLLSDLAPCGGRIIDKRWHNLKVRHLLEHSGGFDRELHGDPQFDWYEQAASAMQEKSPASARTLVRYAMTQPLAFEPGSRFCYSNLGYNILGRVIEKVSGKSYEQFVRKEIGLRSGIVSMAIGRTEAGSRLDGEVRYYERPCLFTDKEVIAQASPLARSLLRSGPPEVELPYGASFVIESMDSHGGWIMRASDMVRFVCALEGKGDRQMLLENKSIRSMVEPPGFASGQTEYYSSGWLVRSSLDRWSHNGALVSSTGAVIIRLAPGTALCVLCNHLPPDWRRFLDISLQTGLPQSLGKII